MAILQRLAPRGEIYEWASNKMRDWQKMIEVLDSPNGVVRPDEATAAFARWKRAQEGLPGLLRAETMVNEGQIACALERYRLAHGAYPETLEALVPQFMERAPHNIINGQALKYRREGGGFLLYSVGWNGTDDGGKPPQALSTLKTSRAGTGFGKRPQDLERSHEVHHIDFRLAQLSNPQENFPLIQKPANQE
jgi:hypothetical protein